MEIFKEWALSLSGIVVFGAVCEMILPNGQFQKYVRLFIGILLVTALLSPLSNLDSRSTFDFSKEAYHQREQLEETRGEDIFHVYQSHLNQTLEQKLKSCFPDKGIKVKCTVEEENEETFGSIVGVLVLTDTKESIDMDEEICAVLERDFSIPKEKVAVHHLKEKD